MFRVSICGVDCTLYSEWKSPNKITSRSGTGAGRGDIIITTLSGGKGTSTVKFWGYHETVGPLHESAVWVEERGTMYDKRKVAYHVLTTGLEEDPLGLSDEANDKRFPEEELLDLFPEGSGRLTADNFIPAWWLLENHRQTTFDDLKSGLNYLNRQVEGHKESEISFLKTNMASMVDQLDTLMALKGDFDKHEQEIQHDPLARSEELVKAACGNADNLFKELLERKDKADETRNTLVLLNRFKFLFALPKSIDENLALGNFHQIVSDYGRAKLLYGSHETEMVKSLMREVEERVRDLDEAFREVLKEDNGLPLVEQKKLIRHLTALGISEDPAWQVLEHKYQAMKETLGQMENSLHQTSCHPSSIQEGEVPPEVEVIERAAGIMTGSFRNFWQLGNLYTSGDLHKSQSPANKDTFMKMVRNLVTIYCRICQQALMAPLMDDKSSPSSNLEAGEHLIDFLPRCLLKIRSCYVSLAKMHIVPSLLDNVEMLITQLRIYTLQELLKKAIRDCGNLEALETSEAELVGDRHVTGSRLPHVFEENVKSVVELIQEKVLRGEQGTAVLQNPEVQTNLKHLVKALLKTFVEFLKRLSDPLIKRERKDSKKDFSSAQVLTTLGNCREYSQSTLPRLADVFSSAGFRKLDEVFEEVNRLTQKRAEKIIAAYIEWVSGPLIGCIEPSMYRGGFRWDKCHQPYTVSSYIPETLLTILSIYAEVMDHSPKHSLQVVQEISAAACEEIARLYSCVKKFSPEGAAQAWIDLQAFQRIISSFLNENAQSLLPVVTKFLEQMKIQSECFVNA
ncbi:unnamed protein product [Darwinula stevensoni]|uniref:Exocyst complex component 2 n=1 Tax=Darwinula stevensoni TaxID=69355 RepID=A0A7R8X2U4_9CRUS|nr:unnamed protein product [Darwinula stevensoni]CAG0881814.1 unnamed protein product [Darwinula stevensoni]